MNVMIVGCGKVGRTLARQLNEDGNNVTVVDLSEAKVRAFASRHDLLGVVGNGATHETLKEAGIESADLMIAVTGSDELNLLCCLIARKAGHCQTVARIKNPVYYAEAPFLKDELGLATVINPEYAAAMEIARVLRFPAAIQIDTFAGGRAELLKCRLPEDSRLVGMAVKEVVAKLHCDVLICTVERGEEAYIAKGDFVFEARDVISVMASPENAQEFFRKIGMKTNAVKSAMIIGAGEMTRYLCKILAHSGISLKVIEKKREKCEEFSEDFPDVTVICGDATEGELLQEEGLSSIGAFVALTNLDEENVLLSLLAKSRGVAKCISRINRMDFDEVIRRLELDTVVSPQNVTADQILQYARAMQNTLGSNVETLYNVILDKVEASEFIIREESAITGTPLSELRFKSNVLVASILRGKDVIIPRGHDVILPGDGVIIVSEIMGLGDITEVLR